MNLNKGISTPITILLIIVASAVVGVLVWQFRGAGGSEPELEKPEATTSEASKQDEQQNASACDDNVTFNYQGEKVTYGTMFYDGECWMDRNLGADSVAGAMGDKSSYGDLFQWGRCADGHQDRESATITGSVSTYACSAGNDWDGQFVIVGLFYPSDWINSQNDDLWKEDGTGINNPCPDGWRVPTEAEWDSASNNWSNRSDAYSSPLKLPSAGNRTEVDSSLASVGSRGVYWSSTVDDKYAKVLRFDSDEVYVDSYGRARGLSIRCLKEQN